MKVMRKLLVRKMEIKSYKCYNTKAEIEFNPNTWIQDQLGNMNSVIKYLTEFKPEFVVDYVQHLIKRIKNAIDSIEKKDGYYDLPAIKEKFEFLDKYPNLRILTQEFLLAHMNPMKKSPTDSKKFIVYGLNQSMAFRRISYHSVKSFSEMIGKEEGIKLYTKILTRIIEDANKKNPQKSDISVTKRRKNAIKSWCEIGMADFTCCVLDEHKIIFRFNNYFAHEALKDFNDPDIAYYASCYGADIPAFNKGRIIHIRRTQTLHHADFCDEMYWDSRVHNNPKQPSLDFTRKLGKRMKLEVIKFGEFNPNALDRVLEIQPVETILSIANNKVNNFACLKRLDHLLGFIDRNYSSFLEKYIENLNTKFQTLLKENLFGDNKFVLTKIFEETDYLKKSTNLVENILSYYIELLRLSDNFDWIKDRIEVKQRDYFRSFLIPNYYYLLVLTETIGREEGIRLFKMHISDFLINQKPKSPINFTTLEDSFEKRKNSAKNPSDWVIIYGMLSKSKLAFRNDNCLWIDVLQDLPDKELKYYVCCYGDYQNANTYSNGNVVLTMEHTIAQGDQYCSRVKHDTRIDWNLEHPKKEFFDNMWPIHDSKKEN